MNNARMRTMLGNGNEKNAKFAAADDRIEARNGTNPINVNNISAGTALMGDRVPDMYQFYKYGENIPRSGKVFSYTFWRTKANCDVFWSVQGNNEMEGAVGGVWIATQYFGNPQQSGKFLQEITLTHPTEHTIQMTYTSTLEEGRNCVFVSKSIVQHFKNDDNSFDFDFKIIKFKSRKHNKNRNKCLI